MSAENKVPAIRFKGFSGEWEEKKLGEVCLIGDIDHRMPQSVKDGIPYLMTGDFIGINDLDFDNAKLISVEDYEQLSKKIKPEKGDILFARYASVGAVRYVETHLKFTVSYSCAILKNSTNLDGAYLFYCLQSNKVQHQVELEINAGSQRNIGIDSLKRILITLPKSREQLEVSFFLKSVDTLIAQHQQKHDKLLNLKKALLEKMFPKQGANVPEIRFKGFSGEWEERNLDDVSIVSTGFPFDSNNFDARGEYLVVTNGNIQDDLPIVDASIGNRVNIEKNSKLNEYVLNAGDILVTMDGTVGRVAKVLNKKQILAQRVGRITAKFDPEFLYQLLCRVDFFKTMTLISHGGTIKHISLSEIGCYKSFFSESIEEQTKVGDFFKNLDTLLNQHQAQLKKLNNIKQACLEKMFV